MTEGGLPKGIVFLTGMMYSDKEFCNWMKEDPKEGLHVYVAKHCDDENVLTHVSQKGFVNRFGYFITKRTCTPLMILIMMLQKDAGLQESMWKISRMRLYF